MQGTMMSSFSFGLIYTRLSRGKVYTFHYDHQHIRLVQLPFCSVIMPFFVRSTMNGTLWCKYVAQQREGRSRFVIAVNIKFFVLLFICTASNIHIMRETIWSINLPTCLYLYLCSLWNGSLGTCQGLHSSLHCSSCCSCMCFVSFFSFIESLYYQRFSPLSWTCSWRKRFFLFVFYYSLVEITADDILRHIYEKELEIIVLLDCSEPVTSNDFQVCSKSKV